MEKASEIHVLNSLLMDFKFFHKKRLGLVWILIFAAINLDAQTLPKCLHTLDKADVRKIKSGTAYHLIDNSELKFLDTLTSNKRIVAVGEYDHDMHDANILVNRVVKYLNECLGYKVVSLENDPFFVFNTITSKDTMTFAYENYLSHSRDTLVTDFDVYMTKRYWENKLILEGIDVSNFHTDAGYQEKFFDYVNTELVRNQSKELRPLVQIVKEQVDKINSMDTAKSRFIIAFNTLKKLENEIQKKKDWKRKDRLVYQLRSYSYDLYVCIKHPILWFGDIRWLIPNIKIRNEQEGLDYFSFEHKLFEQRDSLMALNVMYLADIMYPKEKIIVRASALHINKNSEEMSSNNKVKFHKSMGNYLHERYDDCYLSIPVLVNSGYKGIRHPLNEDSLRVIPKLNEATIKYHRNKIKDNKTLMTRKDSCSLESILSLFGETTFTRFNKTGKYLVTMASPRIVDLSKVFDGVFVIRANKLGVDLSSSGIPSQKKDFRKYISYKFKTLK